MNCLDSPNQNVAQFFDTANNFISSALDENVEGEPLKKKVLVHCFAGKSRATSFTLGYMIKIKKIPLKEGLEMIWKVRPIAAPNPGFMIQLKALEKNCLGENSEIDIVQGMWKEKLDFIMKQKAEKEKNAEMHVASEGKEEFKNEQEFIEEIAEGIPGGATEEQKKSEQK